MCVCVCTCLQTELLENSLAKEKLLTLEVHTLTLYLSPSIQPIHHLSIRLHKIQRAKKKSLKL